MSHFILVHGSWHGGWCWRRVTPLLEVRGHTVQAIDLPGMGEDSAPLGSVTLDSWSRYIAQSAQAASEPPILVGHSRGGVVVSQAAELVPHAVSGLIYLAAMLVQNGQSLVQTSALLPNKDLTAAVRVSEDGSVMTVNPSAVADLFYQLTPQLRIEEAIRSLTPEPLEPSIVQLSLTSKGFGSLPRGYIETLQDLVIPLPLQRAMQAALPCEAVRSLDTDHSPFFSAPEPLVEAICSIAEQLTS